MNIFNWFKNSRQDLNNPIIVNENPTTRDLAGVLDRVGVGLMVIDENDCLSEINISCSNYLELSKSCLGSKAVEVLKSLELVSLVKQVKESSSLVEEVSGTFMGDRSFLVSANFDAENKETLVVLMDTTRSNKLENIRRDFITNLSHELRTPVSVIRANSESLLDGALDDIKTAKKFSQAILKNSEKLTSLLSDILNLSTIESGEYSLNISSTNITPIIDSLVANTIEMNPLVNIELSIKDELWVMCDPQAFEQVVSNLLENAIKYGLSDKSNSIYVKAKNIGSKMRFEFEDRGDGILAEHRKRVFERFYRVQDTKTLASRGTGLGLSIVKNLVNLMDGSVGNEKAHPRGTIFWFTLNNTSR